MKLKMDFFLGDARKISLIDIRVTRVVTSIECKWNVPWLHLLPHATRTGINILSQSNVVRDAR